MPQRMFRIRILDQDISHGIAIIHFGRNLLKDQGRCQAQLVAVHVRVAQEILNAIKPRLKVSKLAETNNGEGMRTRSTTFDGSQ